MGTFGKGFVLGGISALVGVVAATKVGVVGKDNGVLKKVFSKFESDADEDENEETSDTRTTRIE